MGFGKGKYRGTKKLIQDRIMWSAAMKRLPNWQNTMYSVQTILFVTWYRRYILPLVIGYYYIEPSCLLSFQSFYNYSYSNILESTVGMTRKLLQEYKKKLQWR